MSLYRSIYVVSRCHNHRFRSQFRQISIREDCLRTSILTRIRRMGQRIALYQTPRRYQGSDVYEIEVRIKEAHTTKGPLISKSRPST